MDDRRGVRASLRESGGWVRGVGAVSRVAWRLGASPMRGNACRVRLAYQFWTCFGLRQPGARTVLCPCRRVDSRGTRRCTRASTHRARWHSRGSTSAGHRGTARCSRRLGPARSASGGCRGKNRPSLQGQAPPRAARDSSLASLRAGARTGAYTRTSCRTRRPRRSPRRYRGPAPGSSAIREPGSRWL